MPRAKKLVRAVRRVTRQGTVSLGGGATRPAKKRDFRKKGSDMRKTAARVAKTQRKFKKLSKLRIKLEMGK